MDCDKAHLLLCARLDGEIAPEDRAELEAHLDECPACRTTAEAMLIQDADLRQTFEPRRRAAAATARRVSARLTPSARGGRVPPSPRFAWVVPAGMAAAAALLGVAVYLRLPANLPHPDGRPERATASSLASHGLTPKPRPASPPAATLALGESLATRAGERRRVTLPDASVLYLNENTTVTLEGDRDVRLERGEVFAEVAPVAAEGGKVPFRVRAPQEREVKALGTKFAVRAAPQGVGVLVTQGSVEVSGLGKVVRAGQSLPPGDDAITPAPRASHALAWTRDLMAAAESPLVPESKYGGGALVAVDPYGEQAKLSLRKYHIDVHIEDGFARTTIDQTYFNAENFRTEGTFYFPLPPDASLSRLAMYVDGNLMEGGMAERDFARQTYERIRYTQRDPALLEWVDGSLFKMRVFPLEPRQEKRIILSYTQRLPVLYGRTTYRFPGGHNLSVVGEWSFHARVRNGAHLAAASPSHPEMKIAPDGGDLVLTGREEFTKVDRDVVLELTEPSANVAAAQPVRWSGAEHEGKRYRMLRYRPELPGTPVRQRRDWVFVFDACGARDPLVARAQVEVIRAVLDNAEHDDTFALLTASTRVHAFAQAPRPATDANVTAAVDWLGQTHLIGALDLERALGAAQSFLKSAANPHLVFVGGGTATLGEQRSEELIKQIPEGVRFVGVAVGKRFNRAFLKGAAEATGGYFTQINPDEPIGWRGFELVATLNTPRLLDVEVTANMPAGAADNAPRMLLFTNAVSQGEELAAVMRLDDGQPEPVSVTVRGRIDGSEFKQVIPVADVAPGADYLPRTWAKLEIDRLLAEDSAKHKEAIIALSKAMYVMTPYTSLLVLENEAMYEQFKVDRGRKDHWALYPAPAKIPVVYEPDPNQPADRNGPDLHGQKPHANQVLQTILVRTPVRLLNWPGRNYDDNVTRTAGQVIGGSGSDPTSAAFLGNEVMRDGLGGGAGGRTRLMTTGEELGVTLWDAETAGGQLLLPDGVTNGVTIGNVWYDNGRAGDLFNMQLGSLAFTPDGRSLASSDLREATGFFARGVTPTQMPALLTQTERLAEFGYDFDASGLRAGVDFAKARLEDELLFGRRVIMSDGVAPILNPTSRFDTGGELDFRRIPLLHKEVITPYFSVLDTHSNLNDLIAVDFDEEGDNKNLKEFSEAAGRISALGNSRNAPGYYNRPSFSHLDRVFTDLAAYAPGMSTSRADVRAVLEAEAAPRFGGKRGSIDPKARELIDKARSAGWVVTRIPLGEGESLAITHDGRGRYAYERTLPLGLRERVVCDGETLLHLYPELGIGARRQVSRFHRAEFAAIIPDALPPAEDLSHGADVKLIGERTIAIVPHHPAEEAAVEGKEPAWVEEHLVFAENGWLAERRWVLKPADKLLARETYAPDGKVRVFDAEGKERAARNRERKPADAPGLSPDLSELVVLPVPFRTRQHVYAKMELDPNQQIWNAQNGCWEYLRPEEVLELFATEFAQQNGSAAEYIWRNYFLTRQDKLHETTQDKRLGFLVLLSAAGVEVQVPWLAERLASDDPHTRALASYLALLHNDVQRLAQQLVGLPVGDFPGGDGLVRRLFEFRCLLHRWHHPATNERYFPFRQAERDRVIAFAKRNADNPLSWAALSLVLGHSHDDAAFHRAVAGAWATVAEQTGGSYHARYEEARSLYEAGEAEKAAEKFQKLYRETLELGVLPPISDHFQAALRAGGSETDGWRDFMLKTAHDFIAKKRRPAVVLLAWQCHKVGDRPLADLLLGLAVKEVPDRPERLAAHLAAVDYLWQTNQIVEADRLLRELLKDEDLSEQPELWRFAEQVAQRRERKLDAIACLEKALDLEYRRLPPVINLEQVRNDYRRLLDHYEWLAQAVTSLDVEPPRDLLARTVRAADRWRALDPESSDVCERAARILRLVGDSEAKELAWDYLTTPIALRPNESDPWASLAQTLARRGDLRLADRAYEAAYQAEPTNAQLLWDRAENLRQLGDEAERRKVLRQIAAGDWQPRFQWLAAEAKRLTGAR